MTIFPCMPRSALPGVHSRITVRLNESAGEALAGACEREGLSLTEVVCRAVRVYDFLSAEAEAGNELTIRRPGDGEVVLVRLF